ncbi:hypothetical protein [Pelagibacterium limicola]|uniref:hypothetical protein n=1 Tax=Pelagibacterium limicola TaxID=2791022 RepID=UPI0018AF9573|nr:hypothetical protein [Pelagibacterium limicola]
MQFPKGQFEWTRRRRVIFATLAFCAAEIAYLTIWGGDSRLHETIVISAFLLAGSVIGSYVFGAIWDDANARKYMGRGDED